MIEPVVAGVLCAALVVVGVCVLFNEVMVTTSIWVLRSVYVILLAMSWLDGTVFVVLRYGRPCEALAGSDASLGRCLDGLDVCGPRC